MSRLISVLVVAAGISFVIYAYAKDSKPNPTSKKTPKNMLLTFEETAEGSLPNGWKVEATNPKGALATWMVATDDTAPSGKKVLALTKINHFWPGTFNLCWSDGIKFKDGEITVKFKAISGKEDQGGGIMWRVKDKDNYYVARFNPLEDNFRIYYVKNARRRMIKSAKIRLDKQKWHTMKIVQKGNHYECYLNGKKLLSGKDDTFKNAGGVGLWTKADAVTRFDDLTITTF